MVLKFTHDIMAKSTKPIIIMATAIWCPHCAKMKPIVAQLSKELDNDYTFTTFDTDESPELTQEFKITSLPTFIFFRDKKEVGREMGEMTKEELKKVIEKYLG